jgi:hypothetical protein
MLGEEDQRAPKVRFFFDPVPSPSRVPVGRRLRMWVPFNPPRNDSATSPNARARQ